MIMANNVVCKLLINIYFDNHFDLLDFNERNIADVYIVQDMLDLINSCILYDGIFLVKSGRIYFQYHVLFNRIIMADFVRNYFIDLYGCDILRKNFRKLTNLFRLVDGYRIVSLRSYSTELVYLGKTNYIPNWSDIEFKLMEENNVV